MVTRPFPVMSDSGLDGHKAYVSEDEGKLFPRLRGLCVGFQIK